MEDVNTYVVVGSIIELVEKFLWGESRVVRNLGDEECPAKVPKKLKQPIADDIRSVFYASSRGKALKLFSQLKKRWQNDIPSAVKCLENSMEA